MVVSLLADQATDALGQYGALANLTVLAAGILMACVEVMYLRPKREERQQAAMERMQQLFLAECQASHEAQKQSITELRAEWHCQRQEQLRLHERNAEVTAQLAAAVQNLSTQIAHNA